MRTIIRLILGDGWVGDEFNLNGGIELCVWKVIEIPQVQKVLWHYLEEANDSNRV